MAKKIIIVLVIAAAVGFIVYVLPGMLEKEKAERKQELKQMEENAEKRAREMVNKDSDKEEKEEEDDHTFVKKAIDKSSETWDKATHRSVEEMEDYGL